MKARDLSREYIGKIIKFSNGINLSNPDYEFKAVLLSIRLDVTIEITMCFDLVEDKSCLISASNDYGVSLTLADTHSRLLGSRGEWKRLNTTWETLTPDTEIEILE